MKLCTVCSRAPISACVIRVHSTCRQDTTITNCALCVGHRSNTINACSYPRVVTDVNLFISAVVDDPFFSCILYCIYIEIVWKFEKPVCMQLHGSALVANETEEHLSDKKKENEEEAR